MSSFDDDGLSAIPIRAAEAAAALESLKAPAEKAARSIDEAFARAGSSLVRSLAQAASDGEVSLAEQALVERWHVMLEALRAQRWPEVRQMLVALEADDPGRALHALYRKRLDRWELEPPGADWDGVTTFETK